MWSRGKRPHFPIPYNISSTNRFVVSSFFKNCMANWKSLFVRALCDWFHETKQKERKNYIQKYRGFSSIYHSVLYILKYIIFRNFLFRKNTATTTKTTPLGMSLKFNVVAAFVVVGFRMKIIFFSFDFNKNAFYIYVHIAGRKTCYV